MYNLLKSMTAIICIVLFIGVFIAAFYFKNITLGVLAGILYAETIASIKVLLKLFIDKKKIEYQEFIKRNQ